MIAVDTNILLYAHRADSPWHSTATEQLEVLATGPWAIPWPCVHEFLAIATHPRIFDPPTPVADALRTIESWREVGTLTLLEEVEGYWDTLARVMTDSGVTGPRVHDARVAALCLQHAITELWTADRDFSRFANLRTHNPLR